MAIYMQISSVLSAIDGGYERALLHRPDTYFMENVHNRTYLPTGALRSQTNIATVLNYRRHSNFVSACGLSHPHLFVWDVFGSNS